jgi:hypothetical protein
LVVNPLNIGSGILLISGNLYELGVIMGRRDESTRVKREIERENGKKWSKVS